MKNRAVRIDVWSDYVCPFCYLAEPTLALLAQEFSGAVQINWRVYELRPEPVPTLDPNGEYVHDVWKKAVLPMAQARGMLLRLPPVQPRSRLAHEAAAFGRAHGCFAPLNQALFQTFFERGEDIGDLDVLVRLGAAVGLDRAALSAALIEGRYRQQVLDDEALGRRLALSGVPATLVRAANDPLERAILVEGAQPLEVFKDAVMRTLDGSGQE
jgi:predicted DsbA family dithiol-disulfide isomerase